MGIKNTPSTTKPPSRAVLSIVRVGRIERPQTGWKPVVLPLYYTRNIGKNSPIIHKKLFLRNLNYFIKIIFSFHFFSSLKTTFYALVGQEIFPLFHFYLSWLHQSPALGCAVSGIYIHMFTPQALRAMIRIAIPHHSVITMLTYKVLNGTFKAHN